MTDTPWLDLRRAGTRGVSEHGPGVTATHSFSFGAHYDPTNLGFGPIVCHDDHRLAPGAGYDDHPHSGVEIVTWVLDGALAHSSPGTASGTVGAGGAQVLSAGSGVVHAETGEPGAGTTRFVQTWLRADDPDAAPSYAAGAGPVVAPAAGAGLVPVAGGDAELPLGVAGAVLWLATGGGDLALPEAARTHLYLPDGTGHLEDAGDLGAGDAVRLEASGGRRLTLATGSTALVWSFAGARAGER
ncbi:pirin-like bicupin family protein [Nocardioides lentus]|uniref:Pirin-like bicupin family protein n=1 Tax=Nocardioides lentus TaxID=338077 RepID=A0ABP5ABI8_9ACTN